MLERYAILLVVFTVCAGLIVSFVLELIQWHREQSENDHNNRGTRHTGDL